MDFNTGKTQDQGKKSKGLLSKMAFWRDDPAKLPTEKDDTPTSIQPVEKTGSTDLTPFTPANSFAQVGKETQGSAASPPLHQTSSLGDNGEEVLGTLNPHSAFINIFTGYNLGNPDKNQRGKAPDNAGSATPLEAVDAQLDYGVKSSKLGGLLRSIPVELSDSEAINARTQKDYNLPFAETLGSITGPGAVNDPDQSIAMSQEECDERFPGVHRSSVYMTEAEAQSKMEVIESGKQAESTAKSLPDAYRPIAAISPVVRFLMDLPFFSAGKGPGLVGDSTGAFVDVGVNAITNKTETGEFNVPGAVGDAVLGHVVGKGTGGGSGKGSDNSASE